MSAASPEQVSLDRLNGASAGAFVLMLSGIVEHAPEIAEAVADRRPFATVIELHTAFIEVIGNLSHAERIALVARHPELAGREAASGTMTTESVSEQGSAGLDRLSTEEMARLAALNAAYRARFGFPFMICVRRHTRRSIFDEAERRLARTPDEELDEALRQIFFVTRLRVVDRVSGPRLPLIAGRLTASARWEGGPTSGLPVALRDLSDGSPGILMKTGTTGTDGRVTLLADQPLRMGTYELSFRLPASSSFPEIPVRFRVIDPEAHYDIAVKLSPTGYDVTVSG